ncbi:YheC/YheD family protein [Cohnella terricola]|uniref:YheC/YheD family protein n=1 Tax=Cohnella terricola TaxID=1289167 RepID=A0A559JDI5_9BACL|nr:YheC/YheD family protein [Cohnella terricola]TVX97933.1 hypothetical protein FPZ45_16945 [Cohnella terricola]
MVRFFRSTSVVRPIVGVYLGSEYLSRREIKAYYRLRKLVEANRKARTTLTFFTGADVDFARKRFYGAYYDYRTETWRRKYFPLPDVVYVRGGGRRTRRLLEKFDDLGIRRINPLAAFYKDDLFKIMSKDPIMRRHLPSTVIIRNWQEAKRAVRRFGKAYLKAHRGRRGLQVMRIERAANRRGYWYSYSTLGRLVRRRAINLDVAVRSARSFFGSKKIIVQKAIDLVKLRHNRLVDFRAEVQRDKRGELDIVGVCVRVGQPNSPITTHAFAYRYEDYLSKLFPHASDREITNLKYDIKDFLYNVYEAVERKYGQFGEIGIDFGVDRNRRIWLIECNAQSAKVSIVKAYGSRADRIFLNPLEYAKLITENSDIPNRTADRATTDSAASVADFEAAKEEAKPVEDLGVEELTFQY